MKDLRGVNFRKWIKAGYNINKKGDKTGKPIEGTNKYSDFKYLGFFHQFSLSYEEYENGIGNFTVAIIEDSDGVIHEVLTENFKFID